MATEKGYKMVLPFETTGGNSKILREAKILTAGSLLLIDFTHPLSQTSQIPTNESTIKNIAYKEAMSIIGTSEANISPSIINTATNNGMILEFTAKKGLHGIVSQTNDVSIGNDFQIILPSKIRQYIANNISRGFFVSVWDRKTRKALTTTSANFSLGHSNTTNYINTFQTGGGGMLGTQLGTRSNSNNLNSTDPQLNNAAVNAITGTFNTNFNNYNGFKFGSSWAYGSFEVNKACSNILYQLHIIDLQSAGMTYAEADAADLAAFQKAFAVGGKFYNDTFTDPSVLP